MLLPFFIRVAFQNKVIGYKALTSKATRPGGFVRQISLLIFATPLMSMLLALSAAGQTSTRCVTNAGVITCDTTAAASGRPPLDYAKIMQQSGDLVPQYQPPRQEAPQSVTPPEVARNSYSKNDVPTDLFETGNGLLNTCSSNEFWLGATCLAFIEGIAEGYSGRLSVSQHSQSFCLPSNVTLAQSRDVVVKWLRNNPENRHLIASALVVTALNAGFPCTE